MLQYITCGESHGTYLTAIIEGLPSGLCIDEAYINDDLKRRQSGYGRGPRMRIEEDRVVITGGIYKKKTTGAPLGLMVVNKDSSIDTMPQLVRPRPGHADFAGSLKYDQGIREVLERASARETTMRVAVGGVMKLLLKEAGIEILSHVSQIGACIAPPQKMTFAQMKKRLSASRLGCLSQTAEKKMIAEIDRTLRMHDTIGGECTLIATGVPVGLGSHVHYARKLDAAIAGTLIGIQAVKAVQFGLGVHYAETRGSRAHDELFFADGKGYYHRTNNAGGIEGGMSNGEDIVVRMTMKPIATLKKPLKSVNMKTRRAEAASFERSDVCAVTACGVVGEAALAGELAKALLEKCGGDSVREMMRNLSGYKKHIQA